MLHSSSLSRKNRQTKEKSSKCQGFLVSSTELTMSRSPIFCPADQEGFDKDFQKIITIENQVFVYCYRKCATTSRLLKSYSTFTYCMTEEESDSVVRRNSSTCIKGQSQIKVREKTSQMLKIFQEKKKNQIQVSSFFH